MEHETNKPSFWRRRYAGILLTFGTLLLVLLSWYIVSILLPQQALLPSPSRVGSAAYEMWRTGELWLDLGASLKRIVTGFALALVAGIALGIIAARFFRTYKNVAIVLELLSSIPPIAWTPLAILWFGIGDTPAYFIVFLGSFFPLFRGVYAGIAQTNRRHIDAALTLGASSTRVVLGVILPSAIPSILTGIKTAIGVGWFNVIAAELIGVHSGLGYKIQLSRTLLFSENVIALMLIIGIVGWLMVHAVSAIGNLIAPWAIENETRQSWVSRRRILTNLYRKIFVRPHKGVANLRALNGPCPSHISHQMTEADGSNSSDKEILRVTGICKSFYREEANRIERFDALEDINFSVRNGEVFTIVGPNGSGKTTLISIIAGLLPADSGFVEFNGKRATIPSAERTVIFQDFALFPWRTAASNIKFALDSSGCYSEARASDLLQQAGLEQFSGSYPADLSGGMRQRLALVRALAVNPRLILMDEPFASFDPIVREQSQEAILALLAATPTTVLLVTHDLDEAIFMSNRILVLSARPGRTKRILQVELPPNRTAETRKSSQFHQLRSTIWDELRKPIPGKETAASVKRLSTNEFPTPGG